jgi:hypothetical protein
MFHRPFAYLVHTASLEYAYTTVAGIDGEDECYICLRRYNTSEDDDPTYPICVPIALSCGHVLGKHCFDKYRASSNDLELCPQCRRKLCSSLTQSTTGKVLLWMVGTCWFRLHDERIIWRPNRPVRISDSQLKLFSRDVVSPLELVKVILLDENMRAHARAPLFVVCVAIYALLLHCLHLIFGSFQGIPQDDRTIVCSFYEPWGMCSTDVWLRFPESLLLSDFFAGRTAYLQHYPAQQQERNLYILMLVTSFILNSLGFMDLNNMNWRRYAMALFLGRVLHALFGAWAILALGELSALLYILVVATVALMANGQARKYHRERTQPDNELNDM